MPTGFHTRNMILLVEAEDEFGEPLEYIGGPVVPDWGGSGGEAFKEHTIIKDDFEGAVSEAIASNKLLLVNFTGFT